MNRETLRKLYISGNGVEIGPGNTPWVKKDQVASLLYIGNEQGNNTTKLDVIDDGAALNTIDDGTLDFIVSSHVFEHFPNPLGALREWTKKLKVGGVIVMAVPDKNFTFDKPRPITNLDLLLAADADVEKFKYLQFEEWGHIFHKLTGEALQLWVQDQLDNNRNIHFPCWDNSAYREFIEYSRQRFSLKEIVFHANNFEFFTVLEKR